MEGFEGSQYLGRAPAAVPLSAAAPTATPDDGLMAVLRLPEVVEAGGISAVDTIDEPQRSVYVRTANPPCAVLPVGSGYDSAYDFYTLDADPMEFAEEVPAQYHRVVRSGTTATAYDARQLAEAIKANAQNHDIAPEQRSYVLDTEKGACALDRQQYVDLWRQAHDRPSPTQADVATSVSNLVASAPWDQIALGALVPDAIRTIMSDPLARRLLALRLSDAYMAAAATRSASAERDASRIIRAYYTSDAIPEPTRLVAGAEIAIAMGMRDPMALGALVELFGDETPDVAMLAVESLFAALDVVPHALDLTDVENIAIALIDALPLDDRLGYSHVLGLAARTGADDLARHIVEHHLHDELDPWDRRDLISEAEASGHHNLADYFREVSTR